MINNRKAAYLKAIGLIEEYFRSHGIDISLGFELEFLMPRLPDESGNRFFGEILRPDNELDKHLMPDSKLPEYLLSFRKVVSEISEKQGGVITFMKEVPVDKYEAVLCPMPAKKAIYAVEVLKTNILGNMLPEVKANGWADKIAFGSVRDRITPALHTNLGMRIGNQQLFRDSDVSPSEFMCDMAEGMKKAIYETTVLVCPFPAGYERFQSNAHVSYPKEVAVNEHGYMKNGRAIVLKNREVPRNHCMFPEGGKSGYEYVHWIENRLPSGDCQPYVAAFTTLLAAYDAFHKIAKFDSHGKLLLEDGYPQLRGDAHADRRDHPIPKNFHDSRHVFATGHVMRDSLNALDPEGKLGNEMMEMELRNQAKVRLKEKSMPDDQRNFLGAAR